jgi:hypothetical protein
MREAFWISVVVHLAVVIALWNSQRIASWFPHRAVLLVSSNNSTKGKDLTYLELPPDEQQIAKRPDTGIISDKNRRATSKKPRSSRTAGPAGPACA